MQVRPARTIAKNGSVYFDAGRRRARPAALTLTGNAAVL